MDAIDWLQQQEQALWRARIRQLRHEFSESRSVSPKPREASQDVTPTPELGRPQKPARSTLSSSRFD